MKRIEAHTFTRSCRLAAGLFLIAAACGTGHAAEPAAAPQIVHQQADGRVLVWQPATRQMLSTRHAADAVASACLSLDTRDAPLGRRLTVLRNTCSHAVSVTWCVEGGNGSGGGKACSVADGASADTASIAGGDTLALPTSDTATAVNWVACRGDGETVSRLIDGGSRGECLAPDGSPVLADAQN